MTPMTFFLPRISKRRSMSPFTRKEAAVFIVGVRDHAPRYYAFFLCALRTGMRLGELIALQWEDVDYHGRFIEVQRNCALRTITTPKKWREPSSRYVTGTNAGAEGLTD